MNIKHRKTCRICGNPHLTEVIDLGDQYFQGSFIKDGVVEPPKRKTPNFVVRCDTSKMENSCGLIQTKHSIPPSILYTNYWYQSGISNTMKQHLKKIVDYCLSITKLKSGNILDIASNDNTLLRNYPDSFLKTGVDPSDIAGKQNDPDIRVINDIFPTPVIENEKFDIITSIACFYDIEDPVHFSTCIRNMLTDDGIWVFEVAYWPSMLSNLAYDSIVNEHIIHYHLAPLEFMFEKVGLKIINAETTSTNGGSVMVTVCKKENYKYDSDINKKNLAKLRIYEFDMCLDEESTYQDFRSRVYAQKITLINLIKDIKSKNQTIHIYGASTKLNTILGYCNIGPDLIEYASERSPEKHGAKTISGIKLISEKESLNMKPDYYLVGPYHFKEEILEREKSTRELGIKFIFPLPIIEIL
jgi:hypothetical protein